MDRAMLPVRKLFRRLGLVLLAVMIGLPMLQVTLREMTPFSFIGAGELTRFMLICVVFITLPYVVSSGANIRMEEFIALLPVRRAVWRAVFGAAGVLLAGIAAGVSGATLPLSSRGPSALAVPM